MNALTGRKQSASCCRERSASMRAFHAKRKAEGKPWYGRPAKEPLPCVKEKVLRRITEGPCRFREIYRSITVSVEFRQIDRALQNLRQAGQITYVRNQWCLAAPTKEVAQ